MELTQQENQRGIVFSPQQQYAFERLFDLAEPTYNPDGESFWYRSFGFRFRFSCDTTNLDLPEDFTTPKTSLAIDHAIRADNREDRTELVLSAGDRNLSYVSDRRGECGAMNHILGQILKLNLPALADPEDVLEQVRLFDDAAFVEIRNIQKTYDPNRHDPEAEKDAIHLSLTRGNSLEGGRRRIASRLALGRAVQIGGRHFNYWQSLHSNFAHPTVMEPQTRCFGFDGAFSAPSLGCDYRGDNPDSLGRELPAGEACGAALALGAEIPNDLKTFEGRLRGHLGNRFIGELSLEDAVQLVASPLGESLRLRI